MSPTQQQGASIVIGICIALMAVDWGIQWANHNSRIEIHQGPKKRIELSVDINHATWPELTLLPEISETMARRIVESREQEGPFQSIDEITRVQGIGPRTFDRVSAHLKPITAPGERLAKQQPPAATWTNSDQQ